MATHPETTEECNEQQERFCQEYVKDLNGTRAAERADYSGDDATLAATASRLLKYNKIIRRVKELLDARNKRCQVDSDQVLREISRLGYSDLRGLYNDDGTIKAPKDWPDELARAVASIEVEELFEGSGENRTWIGYTKKVKLWPKDRALDMLGKHKKLFTEKVEHSGTITLEALVAGSAPKEIESDSDE